MNNAIIFIRDEQEKQLSKTPYLGGNLLLHAVREVRKIPDLKNVYVGPFGVDMMTLGGGMLYPCVELNLRRTMGHVALAVTPSEPSPQRLLRITYTDRYHLQLMNTFENVINNSLM